MMKRIIFLLGISLLVLAAHAWAAQEYNYRLARISFIQNKLAFTHGDDADWAAATTNTPLQPEDRLYAAAQSRGEIEFDDGSVIRIGENADLTLVRLDDEYIQLKLESGMATLHTKSKVRFEVDTPLATVTPLERGVYRINLLDNGTEAVLVRKGRVQVSNQGLQKQLTKGHEITLWSTDVSDAEITRIAAKDDWDLWNEHRDAALVSSASTSYLPGNVYMGAYDLDPYGRWTYLPDYGQVWSPYTNSGWAPYSVGRWIWRNHWGWTWISYEPWGWLPYHYGRWVYAGGYGWSWIPGAASNFYLWSPGLVRFIQGPNYVSWCPLGPRDYVSNNYFFYRAPYRRYLPTINTAPLRPYNDLQNGRVRGAITTLNVNTFVDGRPQPLSGTLADPLASGRILGDQIHIQPTRASRIPNVSAPYEPPVRQATRGFQAAPAPVRPMNPTIGTRGARTRFEGLPPRATERENQRGFGTPALRNQSGNRMPTGVEPTYRPNTGAPATVTPVDPSHPAVVGPSPGGQVMLQNPSDTRRTVNPARNSTIRNESRPSSYPRPATDNTIRSHREDRRGFSTPRQAPAPAPAIQRPSAARGPSSFGGSRMERPSVERREHRK